MNVAFTHGLPPAALSRNLPSLALRYQRSRALCVVVTSTVAVPRERERVLEQLRAAARRLRARGITHLSLFGSMARGEAGPESDIDLLI